MASTFGGWRSIQLSYGRIDIQIVSEIDHGQSRILESTWLKRRGLKPRRSSPFVLHNLLSVCFRGASATSNAIFVLPSSFANRLVSLVFYDTLDHQKELAFAFGGQRSIQLSYGCGAFHLADWPRAGNGWRGLERLIWTKACWFAAGISPLSPQQ